MENPNKQFNPSGMCCWQTGCILKLKVLLHQNTRNSGGSATSCNGKKSFRKEVPLLLQKKKGTQERL